MLRCVLDTWQVTWKTRLTFASVPWCCMDLISPIRLLGRDIGEFLFHYKINTSNVDLSSICQEKEQICKNLP